MVDIQIAREQEEGERAEDAGFEKIEDFNVTSNAEEKFAGATTTSAEDFTFDMTLQLGGEEREEMSYDAGGAMSHDAGGSISYDAGALCRHAIQGFYVI